MRKIALLGFALALVALAGATAALAGDHGKHAHDADHAELAEGQVKVAVPVTGMSCGSCCTKVETAVAKMEGVVEVKADYEKGVATVVYEESKVDLAKIIETINTETSFKATTPKAKA